MVMASQYFACFHFKQINIFYEWIFHFNHFDDANDDVVDDVYDGGDDDGKVMIMMLVMMLVVKMMLMIDVKVGMMMMEVMVIVMMMISCYVTALECFTMERGTTVQNLRVKLCPLHWWAKMDNFTGRFAARPTSWDFSSTQVFFSLFPTPCPLHTQQLFVILTVIYYILSMKYWNLLVNKSWYSRCWLKRTLICFKHKHIINRKNLFLCKIKKQQKHLNE